METLTSAPELSSFVPLLEHQSSTPASFASGPPVLHYFSDRCKVIVQEDELQNAPALADLVSKVSGPDHTNSPPLKESEETDANGSYAAQKTLEDIDVWVTSE